MSYSALTMRDHMRLLLLPLEAKSLPAERAGILRHFAAGCDVPMDDVHMALWRIETEAYFALEEELSMMAREAANYCLPLCSLNYQERVRQVFTSLTHDLNNVIAKSGL